MCYQREKIYGGINEAMAFGLPVITMDKFVAGEELIENGENGYIVHTDSPQEISNAINQILQSEELCEKMVSSHLKVFGKE